MPKRCREEENYTLTFGDCAENHAGMQIIGKAAEGGLSAAFLRSVLAMSAVVYELKDDLPLAKRRETKDAVVLVFKKGIDRLAALTGNAFSADGVLQELKACPYDAKALMGRGAGRKVKNKRARFNNCFGEEPQQPDYEAGKGTIIAFRDVPNINGMRSALPSLLGEKVENLVAETNFYYEEQSYIGYHGDGERNIVVGARLGADTHKKPLKLQWFQMSKPVGSSVEIPLEHGDIYVMSEKAVGSDWMRDRKGLTLRHAVNVPDRVA
jgi:hypothetical protein